MSFSRAYEDAARLPGQPIPIKPPVAEPGAYPVEALSPKIKAAMIAVVDKVQVPVSIAANSLLAAAALAVQAFVDIELPTGERIPSCLYMVTVASSGDRKSSVDKLALYPVREREREMAEESRAEMASYQADAASYAAAKKKAQTGNKSRIQMRDEIAALGREPIAPPQPMLISDEGTLQGLQKLFAEAMPSLGLFSDEGGQFLGGFAMSEEQRGLTGAALSKLWDGAPIKRVRGTEGVTILRGRRLSLHLMIQHRIARRLFGDPDLKDQGLLSRILIAQPLSLKGDRVWKDPDARSDIELERFQVRIYKMLTDPLPMDPESRELMPRVIRLSSDARALFIKWHDAVEEELKPGGNFEEVTGFAAKLPEHAVRLAAVMAYFEDRNLEEISGPALSAGIKLAQFYASEALRVIGMGAGDDATENASSVIDWIRKKGFEVVGLRYLGRNVSPRSVRGPTLKRAVDLLVEMKHLAPIPGGGHMVVKGKKVFCTDAFAVLPDTDDEE